MGMSAADRATALARGLLAELVTIRAAPVRWPLALGSALSIAAPIVVFAAFGHESLGLMAGTGALLAIYLGARSRHERARALPVLGAGLVLASALGAVAAPSLAATTVVLFVVTTLASVLVYGYGVGPPGAIFFVLNCGVAGHLAAPQDRGGAGVETWMVPALTALGCLIAYVVTLSPLLLPGRRRYDRDTRSSGLAWTFSVEEADLRVVARVVAGTALAILVTLPLGLSHVYWVLLTVVGVLQAGIHRRVTAVRGAHRVIGTIVGLGLFAVIWQVEPRGLWLALVIGALQFGTEMVVVRNYGVALVLITPLSLMIASHGTADRDGLALERLGDTLIGAACAGLVVLLGWRVDRSRRSRAGR